MEPAASKSMSTVSVIIPAFNSSATIHRCLDTVFAHTLTDIEVIIVDDGSTDETVRIIEEFGDRLTIIREPHAGAAAARNQGAKVSSAPFLFFCDADLELDPRILEKMTNVANKRPDVSFVYCGFEWGGKIFGMRPYQPPWLVRQNYISTMSLIRREDFPGFDPNLMRFQDWDLWLTMMERGKRGIGIPEVLFHVQDAPSSLSRRGGISRLVATWKVRRKHHLRMRLSDIFTAVKESFLGLFNRRV